MTLETLGKTFTKHKSVKPLCFIGNESPPIQSDGHCDNTVQRVCYWPVPKYCHGIMGSALLGSHPALSCSSIPAHIIWPWRASAPDALLYLFHPRAEEPPRTGSPSGRERRKEDEWRRIAPHPPFWLLMLWELPAGLSPWIMDWGGGCVHWGEGGEGQTQCSLVWLQVQGEFRGTSVNPMGKVSWLQQGTSMGRAGGQTPLNPTGLTLKRLWSIMIWFWHCEWFQ